MGHVAKDATTLPWQWLRMGILLLKGEAVERMEMGLEAKENQGTGSKEKGGVPVRLKRVGKEKNGSYGGVGGEGFFFFPRGRFRERASYRKRKLGSK